MKFAKNGQLNSFGKQGIRRGLSALLAVAIMLQCALCVMFSTASAASSASAKGLVMMDAANLSHTETLRDNGDGTFTLTVDLSVQGEHSNEHAQNQATARNGYFTASHAGYYLVNLWGGDGAPGGASNNSAGGIGGAGGHIYGTVYLDKGDTLFYTLGGDGVQTSSASSGGGANGDGGAHGDSGNAMVGGGGGYSAVFLFDADDNFAASYLDANGNIKVTSILESDRQSKYIMIAGGGGGGGAGNGDHWFETAKRTPDGGNGGGMDSSRGVVGNGYYFSGSDGTSSGDNWNYIGVGGSDVPGTPRETLLGISSGTQPNDWTGEANPNYEGGAGGAGNWRGGGGGGGYAGASGGLQSSFAAGINVGGGGGGSSYIDATIYDNAIPSEWVSYSKNLINNASTGGSVLITCISMEDDVENALENIVFSGTLSDYFTVVAGSSSASGAEGVSLTITDSSFQVSGNIHADDITLTLTLKPKDNFTGGNNVALLNGASVTLGSEVASVNLASDCTHANVPLNFDLTTKSYITDSTTTKYTAVGENPLLEDESGTWTSMLGYDTFVTAVAGYTVNGVDHNSFSAIPDTPGRHIYPVSYTVTVADTGTAVVGTPVTTGENTFTADAVVTILGGQVENQGDKNLQLTKNLRYEDGQYILSLQVQGTGPRVDYTETTIKTPVPPPDPASEAVNYNGSNGTYFTGKSTGTFAGVGDCAQYTFTAPVDGYYLIQLWSAHGGDFDALISSNDKDGGVGGYAYGYMELTAGQKISVCVGAKGTDGYYSVIGSKNGASGKPSWISSGDTAVMIARGGSGAYRSGTTNYTGVSGVLTGEGDPNNKDGAQPASYVGQSSNNLNTNYRAASVLPSVSDIPTTNLTDAQKEILANFTDPASVDDGQTVGSATITCILPTGVTTETVIDDTAAKEAAKAVFADPFNIDLNISPYFTVVGTRGTDAFAEENILIFTQDDNTADGAVSFADIQPAVSTNQIGEEQACQSSVDFTVDVVLKPKEGFLGGNDVPVLAESTQMQLSQSGISVSVAPVNATDYANVAVPVLDPNDMIIAEPPTYILGTGAVDTSSLYNWMGLTTGNEFLTVTGPTLEEENWVPTADDTTNMVTVTLDVQPAEKAVVIDPVSGSSVSKPVAVNVINQVRYNLGNITTSHTPEGGYYLHPLNTGYTAILTAAEGYELPDASNLTVTSGGITLTDGIDYTYDITTGELVIPASSINNRVITITGEAKVDEKEYSVHFISADAPELNKTFLYHAGDFLSAPQVDSDDPADNAKAYLTVVPPDPGGQWEGYTFTWTWDGASDDQSLPEQMPTNDIWVFGTYTPNEYTLTVNYYKNDSQGNPTEEPIAESVTQQVPYGKDFSVASPTIAGWVADKPVVTGTMPLNGCTMDVYYTQTTGALNIFYLYKESGETAATTHTQDIVLNGAYTVASPAVEGHTPDRGSITTEVTSEEILTAGITEYVYYTPDRYTVNLVDEGTTSSMLVEYGKQYSYYSVDGGANFVSASLPIPVKTGYTFLGWYQEDTKISESTVVGVPRDNGGNVTDTITLNARWQIQSFTVTVNYRYGDGTKAADSVTQAVEYGKTYDIESPQIEGYTPSQAAVSGTMSNSNVVADVIYTGVPHRLTIQYLDFNTGEAMTGMPAYTQMVPYRSTYSVASPAAPEGYHIDEQDKVVTGTMPNYDLTRTVYYKQDVEDTLVKVTVTWGDLNFAYDYGSWNPNTHKYEGASITESANNTITIENDGEVSNINVYAVLEYTGNSYYQDLYGYFTNQAGNSRIDRTGEIAPGKTEIVKVWLEGLLPDNLWGQSLEAGRCTVTIRAGGKAGTNSGGETP